MFGMASPLSAQTVLDRTDPTQAEEDAVDPNDSDDPSPALPTIERSEESSVEGVAEAGQTFTVGSVLIEGNTALPDTEFIDLIEDFIARPLSQTDLELLADAVAGRARDRGYIFATATIPRQSLALGILRIRLDEGRIDDIRIVGADDPAIRRQLAPLLSANAVTRAELERRILLADDISGVRILDTRFEREGERGVLFVETRRSRTSASIEARNNGSEAVGPVRSRLEVDLNGLLTSADEFDITVGTTPFEPGELQYARASYGNVVNADGLEITSQLSYSRTEPGAFLSDRDILGRFWRAGVELRHPLLRSRDTSVWAVGQFEVTDLKQDRAGALARHDQVPALRAGLYSRGRLAGGDYRGSMTVSRGLDILSATQPGDPLASRSDASAQFTSLYGWFAWDRPLVDAFSGAIGGRGQLASDPVLATEDLGLGGPSFLRGYKYNERSGDQGVMGYGELRYDWRGDGFWLPKSQLYAYVDGGVVSNLEDGRGGGSLASAGGGVRLDITRDLDLDLEVAVPLSGPRFDSDSEAPLVNFRIEQSF